MEEVIKYLEEIKEHQMQTVQLARSTEVYKLADKALKAIDVIHCSTQLLCVNTHENWGITENKLYKKIGENQREYIIKDDKGKRAKFFKRHFEEIQM